MKTLILTATMIGALAFSGPALAAPATSPEAPSAHATSHAQIEIRHADLDLSDPRGMQELERRIQRAARKLCTVPAVTGSRIDRLDNRCHASAVESARQHALRNARAQADAGAGGESATR